MRLVNPSKVATEPVGNGFRGRTDGLTYTGTADDPQLLRVWGNITDTQPKTGMYSAILTDMSSGVTATENATIADGAVTMPATFGWWWDGILFAKGARVTIPCRGWFSDEDWRVMQALGVVCFARDTAAY